MATADELYFQTCKVLAVGTGKMWQRLTESSCLYLLSSLSTWDQRDDFGPADSHGCNVLTILPGQHLQGRSHCGPDCQLRSVSAGEGGSTGLRCEARPGGQNAVSPGEQVWLGLRRVRRCHQGLTFSFLLCFLAIVHFFPVCFSSLYFFQFPYNFHKSWNLLKVK